MSIITNDTRNNMAVVVRIEGKKYYKVHRVMLPDGSQLTFEQNKKDIAQRAGGVDNNSGLSPTANVFSKNNIIEKNENVKPDLFSTKEIRTDIDIDVAEEYIKINRELEKENAKLKELVKLQKERARQQGKITNGKIIRPSSISAQAVLLKKQYGISGVKGNTELEALLKTYYDYVIDHADTDDINLFTLEQTMRQAKPVSDWIISKMGDKQQFNGAYDELNALNDIDLERVIRYIEVYRSTVVGVYTKYYK